MLTMYNNRQDFRNTECDTAILTIGALEQHGSHLPYGTDTLIAWALAERLAKTLDAYLLPPISIASSIEHRAAKGTVYLKADTLALVIRDIAESLLYSGFSRLLLINGHGGNWILKPTIRQLNRDFADRSAKMEAILIHTSIALSRQHEVMEYTKLDIHGGEKETSLMLHLCPAHVKDYIPQTAPTSVPQDFMDYFDVTELTEDGYWGYPEAASAEKGLKMMDLMEECSLAYLQQIDREKARIRNMTPNN
jgi:creatinine amidohydrolase